MAKKKSVERSKIDKTKNEIAPEKNLTKLIVDLNKISNMKYSREKSDQLEKIRTKIIAIGEPAILPMIKILEDQEDPVWDSAAKIMGELRDERAIMPLINALENRDCETDIVANET